MFTTKVKIPWDDGQLRVVTNDVELALVHNEFVTQHIKHIIFHIDLLPNSIYYTSLEELEAQSEPKATLKAQMFPGDFLSSFSTTMEAIHFSEDDASNTLIEELLQIDVNLNSTQFKIDGLGLN